jgi:hypothetical protein
VVDGYQRWGRGAIEAMAELRSLLDGGDWVEDGDERYILVDSVRPDGGARGMNDVNGVEMEHFPWGGRGDDYVPYLSSGFLHLTQAVNQADVAGGSSRDAFSYAFTKEKTAGVPCGGSAPGDKSFRVGLAASTLLLMPHAYAGTGGTNCFGLFNWPEYYADGIQRDGWLGQQNGGLVRVPSNSGIALYPPQSNYKVWDEGEARKVLQGAWTNFYFPEDFDLTDIVFEGEPLSHMPDVDDVQVRAELQEHTSNVEMVAGFTMSAQSTFGSDTAEVIEDPAPPRLVSVHPVAEDDTDFVQTVLVPQDGQNHSYQLTFLNAGLNDSPIEFVSIRFGEEPGLVNVSALTLFTGTVDRWYRVYDHGGVFLNGSHSGWTVTPGSITGLSSTVDVIGGSTGVSSFTVPALDATYVRKVP